MPLLVVYDQGHAPLADPFERGTEPGTVDSCVVCGAVTRLRRHTGQGEPVRAASPPIYDILGSLHGGTRRRVAGRLRGRAGVGGGIIPAGGST